MATNKINLLLHSFRVGQYRGIFSSQVMCCPSLWSGQYCHPQTEYSPVLTSLSCNNKYRHHDWSHTGVFQDLATGQKWKAILHMPSSLMWSVHVITFHFFHCKILEKRCNPALSMRVQGNNLEGSPKINFNPLYQSFISGIGVGTYGSFANAGFCKCCNYY
jgi:hypothetical protein